MTIRNKNDGHLSAGMCQAAIDDATDIMTQIAGMEDCDLPTWWTSKLAVASAYLNSLRDYITYNIDDIIEEAAMEDEAAEQETSEVETAEDAMEDDMTDIADEMLPPSARMMKNATKEG